MALTFRTPPTVPVVLIFLSPFITHFFLHSSLMSRPRRLRWTFAAPLYGWSHRCPSPPLLGEKFLKIIPQQHSPRKCVLIWKATRQSPMVPANLKYSTILWFTLLLLYHFLVIFCVLNSPSLLSFHLRCPSNDLQVTFSLPLDVRPVTCL